MVAWWEQQPAGQDSLDAWRPRAVHLTLIAANVTGVPATVVQIWREPSTALNVVAVVSCAAVVAAALLPRVGHVVRAYTFLLVGYVFAVMTIHRQGIRGAGSLILAGLPLFALLMIGRRTALAGAALSVAAYAAFTVAVHRGDLRFEPGEVGAGDWLALGVVALTLLVPLGVLIEWSMRFQEHAVRQATEAGERLRVEAEERERLEREVIEVGERERRAIGHELHDGLCQQLTGGLVTARLLERGLAQRSAPEAVRAAKLAEVVDMALADARSLARGLSPQPIPAGGLGAALRNLAQQIRERVEVECEVLGVESPAVGGEEATQLYRIAQEATQNSIKHGAAGRITMELSEDAASVGMRVRDDGRGLPPQLQPGLGMRSMKGRAVALGGTLEVGPAQGGGVEVVCRVPRSGPRAASS